MENRRKIEPKQIPSRLIPRLVVVFTRQLEILVTTLLKFDNGHYDTRKLLKGDSVLEPTFSWSWRPLSPMLYCGVGNNHSVIPRCYASPAAVKIFQETDSRPVACQHLQRPIP